MKKIMTVWTGVMLALSITQMAFAGSSATFTMTAKIPEATVVAFIVSEVDPAPDPDVWTSLGEGSQTLAYDMAFNTATGLFLPKKFFAIDLATRDASGATAIGTPDLTITYTEGSNPNSAIGKPGLGDKGTITVVRVDTNSTTNKQEEAILQAKSFSASNGDFISDSSFAGGFGRVYLGISTGEGVGNPFTFADKPGTYSGTVLLSSTVN